MERLPEQLPALGSSIIDNFIAEQVSKGITSSQGIANAFKNENMPGKIKQYIAEVKIQSEKINWSEVFTAQDAQKAKDRVLKEMQEMNISEANVARVAAMNIDIAENIGVSTLSNEAIIISKLQAVRKAMDLKKVVGDAYSLEEIVSSLLESRVGHELGHKINEVTGAAINNIPPDESWNIAGETEEKREERFAEYWALAGSANFHTYQNIVQREFQVQLAAVNQTWKVVQQYNETQDIPIDVRAVFKELKDVVSDDVEIVGLLDARVPVYKGNTLENYAMPYTRDKVFASVNNTI